VFRRRRNQLRHCYETQLVRDRTLRARVVLQLVIASDGQVTEVSAGPAAHAELAGCLEQTVAAWRFPSYRGQQVHVVSYPLRFRPDR
jgi:hypothetical protein